MKMKIVALVLAMVMLLIGCEPSENAFVSEDADSSEDVTGVEVSEEVESSAAESGEISENSDGEASGAEASGENGESGEVASADEDSEDVSEASGSSATDGSEDGDSDNSEEEKDNRDNSKVDESKADESKAPVKDESKPDESEPVNVVGHVHTWTEVMTFEPTCKEIGRRKLKCSCGEVKWEDYGEATGCVFEYAYTKSSPSVTEEGIDIYRCKSCKAEEQRTVAKIRPMTDDELNVICNRIIELLNEERAKIGAPMLSTAPIAHEMAMVRAEELSIRFEYTHARPDGRDSSTIYEDYKYNPNSTGWYGEGDSKRPTYKPLHSSEDIHRLLTGDLGWYGEDIPLGYASETVFSFSNSAGHWKDLMKAEYTGVGVGIFVDYEKCAYYVCILTMDKTYG